MKKLFLAGSFGTALLLGACGSEVESETNMNEFETSDVSETTETVEANSDVSAKIKTHKIALEEIHGADARIEYRESDKSFIITPTSQSFIDTIVYVVNKDKVSWKELVDGYADISEQIKNDVGEGYSIKMTNPQNREETIIFVKDGMVLFSAN